MNKETLAKLGPEGRELLVYILKVLSEVEVSKNLTDETRATFFETVEEIVRFKSSFFGRVYQC